MTADHHSPVKGTDRDESSAIESDPLTETDRDESNARETSLEMDETVEPAIRARIEDAIGEDEFEIFRSESSLFIDKSLFIKKFFEHGTRNTVILRPRRFGKSLNLTMLKCFLDQNQKDPRKLFEGLEIMKDEDFVKKHMGQYPVVSLSLKDCTGKTWQKMREHIWDSLFEMCEPHIKTDPGLKWKDLVPSKYIQENPRDFPEDIDDTKLEGVFYRIVQHVYEKTEKPVVILIDEYDAPMNVNFSRVEDKELRSAFFKRFFSRVLKGNKAVDRALLVGVFEIRGESILSGLNNLTIFSIADDTAFGDCFGFTESEVKECLRRDLNKTEDYIETLWRMPKGIQEFYNGYMIGGHSIINPWSFMQYLRTRNIRSYWTSTAPADAVFTALKERNAKALEILQLIKVLLSKNANGERERIAVPALKPLRSNALSNHFTQSEFLHFMCMSGYLTYQETDHQSGVVWIPNEELRLEWDDEKLLSPATKRSKH